MKNELNIVGIQSSIVWEKPAANLEYFDQQISKLPSTVDLVILPEMFTTGFSMNPISIAETMEGPSIKWMVTTAKTNRMALVGSVVIKENAQYFNRLFFIHPNGHIETYDKRHLFTLAKENDQYTSGEERLIVFYKGWRICPLICYDLRFPVWSRNTNEYDLLVFVANWPSIRIHAWDTLLKARAIENMSYCIGVNRVGKDENGYEYNGHTAIYNFLGEKLSRTIEGKENILQCVVSKNELQKIRQKLNFLEDQDAFKIEK
jgi:predicted amidohydrolase